VQSVRPQSVVAILVALLACAACSSWDPPPPVQAPASARLNPAELLGAMTARQVVDALPRAGLPTAHPVDSTAAECPDAGCEQSIVTDQFRILSFAGTGAAEKYAADHGARQVETLALTFSPSVPMADQDRYWAAIVNLAR
jgi:hypothetical protein